jgi:hypothetical protein
MNVNYNTLQADVLAYLCSDSFFANVFLYAGKPNDPAAQVANALSGLKATNGKCGASIEISKPFLVDPMPNAPGPTAVIEMRFIVKVNPLVNNGQAGTKLTAEMIDSHLIQSLLEWGAEGSQSGSFYCPGNFSSPAHFPDDAGLEGRLVVMHAKISFTPLARTAAPLLSENPALTCVITNQDADGATVLLYTTDGSMPGYKQGTTTAAGTAQIYAAPFAVASGTTIRAIAISSTKLPSICQQCTIT